MLFVKEEKVRYSIQKIPMKVLTQNHYTKNTILILAVVCYGTLAKFPTLILLGLLFFTLHTSRLLSVQKKDRVSFFLTGISSIMLVEIAAYMTIGSSFYSIGTNISIHILVALLSLSKQKNMEEQTEKNADIPQQKNRRYQTGGIMVWLFLVCILIGSRTNGLLTSPWHSVPQIFFVLFAALCILLWYDTAKNEEQTISPLLPLMLFAAWGVSAIVYTLGYGFDPQLHIASSTHIFTYGNIDPITPLYLTQYVAINILAHLTSIGIHTITAFLVPILASTLLPYAVYRFLRKDTSHRGATMLTLSLILFLPKEWIATTPYNLSTVLSVSAITFALWSQTRAQKITSILLGTLALLAHPLPGCIAWIAIIVMFLVPATISQTKKILLAICAIISSFIFPALFSLYYSLFQSYTIERVLTTRPLADLVTLFASPRYYAADTGIILEALYSYERLLPIGVFTLAIYAIWKRNVPFRIKIAAGTSLLLLANALTLYLCIQAPELHQFDAAQYAERLLHSAVLCAIPPVLFCVLRAYQRVQAFTAIRRVVPALGILCLIPAVYLTHPQHNRKVIARGFNTTVFDMALTADIHEQASGDTFAALAPAPTAAASVRQFGFTPYITTASHSFFAYAIPSGSYLGLMYNTLMSEGFSANQLTQVFIETDVQKLYVVIPSYWDNAKARVDEIQAMNPEYTKTYDDQSYTLFLARFDRDTFFINRQQ
jgi:hypothetical protein